MCTAVTYQTRDRYFGRNLDLEFSYDEEVTIMPRNFPVCFRNGLHLDSHPAVIGTAYVVNEQNVYPLFYDAGNEYGVAMAGLNFPDYAYYGDWANDNDVAAPFEFIPWVLCQCRNMEDVKNLLSRTVLVNMDFSEKLPVTPLHWIIAAPSAKAEMECITVEPEKTGLKIYDNPVGVLTNSPDFKYHMTNLSNYMTLSARPPVNTMTDAVSLTPYSRGMGGLGLPGDLSSASRFVRAAIVKLNSLPGPAHHKTADAETPNAPGASAAAPPPPTPDPDAAAEARSVSQFFHILGAVEQQRGCVRLNSWEQHCVDQWENEITVYSSCFNVDRGIYYYKTYDDSTIRGVDMHLENLDRTELIRYPMKKELGIDIQNSGQR